jgi:uncharacterized DUF497 family protein
MDRFVWDDEKAESNLATHGVSFETAEAVFDDPLLLTRMDIEPSELRFQAIGRVAGSTLLFVVHTVSYENERDTVIRIISARLAERAERRAYHNAQADSW